MSDTQPTPTFDPDGTALRRSDGLGELDRLGGYVIRRLLGEGGMGRVYVADDPALGRQVALKVMRPEAARRADAKERFLREARAAAAVTHDHIVRIYQVGEDGGVPFIAMELLAGHPLDSLAGKPAPMADVIRIGTEVASALAVAHAAGLVHRDIKPANLWVEEPSGRVKVLDFGLARLTREVTLTNTGQIFGTPAYMAPEQAAAATLDGRADVFSLGCVLYHLTTGRRPFDGPDVFAVLHQIANLTPPPPRHLNPHVPAGLSDLITRMMAKAAADRPASADQVVDELRGIADGTATCRPTPSSDHPPAADSSARKQGLIALLLETKKAHARLSITPVAVLHVLIAVSLGVCGFSFGVLLSNPTPLATGLCGGGIAGISYLAWHYWRWRERRTRTVDRLLREYPVEASRWVGSITLRDRAVVEALLTAVQAEDFVVSPAAIRPATEGEAGRKLRLVTILLDAKAAHKRLSLFFIPPLWEIVLGLFVAFLGIPIGLLVFVVGQLAGIDNRPGGMSALSAMAGTATGFVWVIGSLLTMFLLSHRKARRQLRQAGDRLMSDFRAEATEWGGELALQDRAVVDSLLIRLIVSGF